MQSSRLFGKCLFFSLFFMICLSACSSDDSNISGYWKLTSIELPDKTVIPIDSQFYAFQKRYVFSFTRLINSTVASISYGYADYPEDGAVRIEMDANNVASDFDRVSYWQCKEAVFSIYTSTSSHLILEKGDTLFILKKY